MSSRKHTFAYLKYREQTHSRTNTILICIHTLSNCVMSVSMVFDGGGNQRQVYLPLSGICELSFCSHSSYATYTKQKQSFNVIRQLLNEVWPLKHAKLKISAHLHSCFVWHHQRGFFGRWEDDTRKMLGLDYLCTQSVVKLKRSSVEEIAIIR